MQPETFTELSTRQTDGLNSRGWIYLRGSSWSVDKNLELTLSPTPPPELWSVFSYCECCAPHALSFRNS